MKPVVVFWYEFASPYSYLSAMRINAAAERAGVEIRWQPFLLGPIFRAQGWATSPFNLYPAKGRYMVRDVGRIAGARGVAFKMPVTFPANGLKAARLAIATEGASRSAFSRAVFGAAFGEGLDIADDAVLARCLETAGLDVNATRVKSLSPGVKAALREATDAAQQAGIFGAPSFTTEDGELFWGDDRLEAALAWPSEHSEAVAADDLSGI